ncbi:hypothetical protein [Gimesia maris]|uniref:hypothetical protein n=1 Tax=Gimesia maris TaxID=122 RepID=UPI003A9563F2|tara:strand:- start:147 stop:476 length:330 start_codon:yes stop_codon:yes gene_type:complete
MKDALLKILYRTGDFTYGLSWQLIKLAMIAPFLLGLFLQADLVIKISFVSISLPIFCFFIAGLTGLIGNLFADKSMQHQFGPLFTNLFLTLWGGYGFASICYVLITRVF